jgi:hypothetical protein
MRKLSKKQQQNIINTLSDALQHSEKVWESKEQSHAYIIGYLQGAIKSVILELNQD